MRVIIADDSVLLREGLAHLLEDAGIEVLRQVGDAEALLAAVATQAPDLCIIDIRMPPTHTTEGLQAALTLRRTHPGVRIVVLSQYVETEFAMELLGRGADGVGYLLKDRVANTADFLASLRSVAAGRSVVDPTVAQRLMEKRHSRPTDLLSEREREVLRLMAEGRSNAAIGSALGLSAKTVETHVTNIFSKLGMPDSADDNRRVLSVLEALRSGVV